jgi:hypothetical protein
MKPEKIKSIIDIISLITMAAGLFGMVFCYQFLWSTLLEDLVGAGFPFVGGSVLFGFGLISLTLNNKK